MMIHHTTESTTYSLTVTSNIVASETTKCDLTPFEARDLARRVEIENGLKHRNAVLLKMDVFKEVAPCLQRVIASQTTPEHKKIAAQLARAVIQGLGLSMKDMRV